MFWMSAAFRPPMNAPIPLHGRRIPPEVPLPVAWRGTIHLPAWSMPPRCRSVLSWQWSLDRVREPFE